VVEELIVGARFASPTVHVDISPRGEVIVLSTREQVLEAFRGGSEVGDDAASGSDLLGRAAWPVVPAGRWTRPQQAQLEQSDRGRVARLRAAPAMRASRPCRPNQANALQGLVTLAATRLCDGRDGRDGEGTVRAPR
jgi:hypothetical protein